MGWVILGGVVVIIVIGVIVFWPRGGGGGGGGGRPPGPGDMGDCRIGGTTLHNKTVDECKSLGGTQWTPNDPGVQTVNPQDM